MTRCETDGRIGSGSGRIVVGGSSTGLAGVLTETDSRTAPPRCRGKGRTAMVSNARILVRNSLFASLIAASLLTTSGSARAQSVVPERALLNQSPERRAADAARAPSGPAAEARVPIDGVSALLNRRAVTEAPSEPSVRTHATHATLARGSRDPTAALLNHASL